MPDRNRSQNQNQSQNQSQNPSQNLSQKQSKNLNPNRNHVLRAMQNQNYDAGGGNTLLPESPETPTFGPPPAAFEGENLPASPTENPNMPLPTPTLPGNILPGNRPSQRPNGGGTQRPGSGIQPPSGGGTPIIVYPIPILPGNGQSNRAGYCNIRFLNAAVGYDSVNVSIGNRPLAHGLEYGEVSSYFTEVAGFKNVRVTEGGAGRVQIAQERFLFNDGDVYTIALVNAVDGISMVLISDSPCRNEMQNFGCVRAANLSYNAPAVDVVNRTERVVFDDLRFKSVAAYRQIMQGEQMFFVTESMSGAEVFDITEWIEPGRMYTLYIVGDAYTFPGLTGIFTEDYSLLME